MLKLAYLDTSVILKYILKEAGSYKNLHHFESLYTSHLTRVESFRTIDRLRIQEMWPDPEIATRIALFNEVSESLHIIPIQESILQRASEPFPTIVKTLDAIHIASALLIQTQLSKPLLFLTHDHKQAIAAKAVGLKIL